MSTQYGIKQILDSDIILSEIILANDMTILNHGTHLNLFLNSSTSIKLILSGISSSIIGLVELQQTTNDVENSDEETNNNDIIQFMTIEGNGVASAFELNIASPNNYRDDKREIVLFPFSRHEPQNYYSQSSSTSQNHVDTNNNNISKNQQLESKSKIFNILLLSESQYKNDIFPATVSSCKRISPSKRNNNTDNSFVCAAVVFPSLSSISSCSNQETDSGALSIFIYLFSFLENKITSSCVISSSINNNNFRMNLTCDTEQQDKDEYVSNHHPNKNQNSNNNNLSVDSVIRVRCTEIILELLSSDDNNKKQLNRHVLEVRTPLVAANASSPLSSSSRRRGPSGNHNHNNNLTTQQHRSDSSKLFWKSSSSSSSSSTTTMKMTPSSHSASASSSLVATPKKKSSTSILIPTPPPSAPLLGGGGSTTNHNNQHNAVPTNINKKLSSVSRVNSSNFFGRPTASTFSSSSGEILMANKDSVIRRVAVGLNFSSSSSSSLKNYLWGEISTPVAEENEDEEEDDDERLTRNNNMWCFPSSSTEDENCLFIFVEDNQSGEMILYKTIQDDNENRFLKQMEFQNEQKSSEALNRKILHVGESENYFFWIFSDATIAVLKKNGFVLLSIVIGAGTLPATLSLRSATSLSSTRSASLNKISFVAASDDSPEKMFFIDVDVDSQLDTFTVNKQTQPKSATNQDSCPVFKQLVSINNNNNNNCSDNVLICGIVEDLFMIDQESTSSPSPLHHHCPSYFYIIDFNVADFSLSPHKVSLPSTSAGKPCKILQLQPTTSATIIILVQTTNHELFIFEVDQDNSTKPSIIIISPLVDCSSRITNVASVARLNDSSVLIFGKGNVSTQIFVLQIVVTDIHHKIHDNNTKTRKYSIEKHRICLEQHKELKDNFDSSTKILVGPDASHNNNHSWIITKCESSKTLRLYKNLDQLLASKKMPQQQVEQTTSIVHDHHLQPKMIITTMISTQNLLFLGVMNFVQSSSSFASASRAPENGILVLDLLTLSSVKAFFPLSLTMKNPSFCTSSILTNSVVGEENQNNFAVFGTSSGEIISISSSTLKIVSRFVIPSSNKTEDEDEDDTISASKKITNRRRKISSQSEAESKHIADDKKKKNVVVSIIALCASKNDPSLIYASLTNNFIVAIRLFSNTVLLSSALLGKMNVRVLVGSISHQDVVSLDTAVVDEKQEAVLCGSLSSGVSCLIFKNEDSSKTTATTTITKSGSGGTFSVSCADPTPNHVLFACFDGRNCRHGDLDSFNFLVLDAYRNLSWGRTPENKKKKKNKKSKSSQGLADPNHQENKNNNHGNNNNEMNGNGNDDDQEDDGQNRSDGEDNDYDDDLYTSPCRSNINKIHNNNSNNNTSSSHQHTSSSSPPTTTLANEPQPTHLETPSTIWGGGCKVNLSSSNLLVHCTNSINNNIESSSFFTGSSLMETIVSFKENGKNVRRSIWQPSPSCSLPHRNDEFSLNDYGPTEGRSEFLVNPREIEFYQRQFINVANNKNYSHSHHGHEVKFMISATGSISCLFRMPRSVFEVAVVIQSTLIRSIESVSCSSPSSSSVSTFCNPTFVSPFRRTVNASFVLCSILKWFAGGGASNRTNDDDDRSLFVNTCLEAIRREFPSLVKGDDDDDDKNNEIEKLISSLISVGGMI